MSSDCISGATSLAHILHRRAGRHPERRALTSITRGTEERKAYSFAGLDQRARTIAALLKAHGMEGERALLLYPPGLDFIAAFFGCLYASTVAVPVVPPALTGDELGLTRVRGIAQNARVVQYEYARKLAPNVSAIITDGRSISVPFAQRPAGARP